MARLLIIRCFQSDAGDRSEADLTYVTDDYGPGTSQNFSEGDSTMSRGKRSRSHSPLTKNTRSPSPKVYRRPEPGSPDIESRVSPIMWSINGRLKVPELRC